VGGMLLTDAEHQSGTGDQESQRANQGLRALMRLPGLGLPGATECPAAGVCMNCMPINDVDTCWPVKTPILYKLKSYGQVENADEAGMMSEVRLQRCHASRLAHARRTF
jgi:hypothetical protein